MTQFNSRTPRLTQRPLVTISMLILAGLWMRGVVTGTMTIATPGPAARSSAPEPPVVSPGGYADRLLPAAHPSDAVVLFDGASLRGWRGEGEKPAAWDVENKPGGAMTIVPGTGGLFTELSFGDAQIHIEFATPVEPRGEGQDRGNSGVYIQGRYEVQVLDSFKSSTYSDGQCGGLYGQHAPLVNACREPGAWQTYDIIFRAARFDDAGTRLAPARMTVLHNGVVIHDHAELRSETTAAPIKEGPGPGPLYLQDHGHRVRYRSVWVRPLTGP